MRVEETEDARSERPQGIPWSAEVSDAATDPGDGDDVAAAPSPPAPLVPLTVSDLLDGAYNVVKRRPVRVLGAVAIIVVPIRLISAFALRRTTTNFTASNAINNIGAIGRIGDLTGLDLFLAVASYLLSSLSLFFIGGVVASFMVAWFEGIDLSMGAAVKMVLRRSGAFAAAWVILLPVKALSAAFLFLPLVLTTALFCLTAPVILVERAGPIIAIKRAVSLAWRRYFAVLWVVVLATVVAFLGSLILSRLPLFVADLLPSPLNWIGNAVVLAAAEIVTGTALAATMVLLYFDIRVRTEGFDLAHRQAAIFEGGPR